MVRRRTGAQARTQPSDGVLGTAPKRGGVRTYTEWRSRRHTKTNVISNHKGDRLCQENRCHTNVASHVTEAPCQDNTNRR